MKLKTQSIRQPRLAFSTSLAEALIHAKSYTAEVLLQNHHLQARPGRSRPLHSRGASAISKANQVLIQQLRTSATIYSNQIGRGVAIKAVRTASKVPTWSRRSILEVRADVHGTLRNKKTPRWVKRPLRNVLRLINRAL